MAAAAAPPSELQRSPLSPPPSVCNRQQPPPHQLPPHTVHPQRSLPKAAAAAPSGRREQEQQGMVRVGPHHQAAPALQLSMARQLAAAPEVPWTRSAAQRPPAPRRQPRPLPAAAPAGRGWWRWWACGMELSREGKGKCGGSTLSPSSQQHSMLSSKRSPSLHLCLSAQGQMAGRASPPLLGVPRLLQGRTPPLCAPPPPAAASRRAGPPSLSMPARRRLHCLPAQPSHPLRHHQAGTPGRLLPPWHRLMCIACGLCGA